MSVVQRFRAAARSESYHDRLIEMGTEFLQEAAVLVAVLGILDATIARGTPTFPVLAWSLGIGFILFVAACVLQALRTRAE